MNIEDPHTTRTNDQAKDEEIARLREALESLELSASRVAYKYGWDEESQEPLDWTEWQNVRDDCAAARLTLGASNG